MARSTVHPWAPRKLTAAYQLEAEMALKEIRGLFDGTIVLIKGLELSCRYPDPSDRPFGDIDLLSDEPERLQETLLSCGYSYVDGAVTDASLPYSDPSYHELASLRRPNRSLSVDVHRSPGWLPGMTPPPTSKLINQAVASATRIDGIRALEPSTHAVYVAVHSWMHRPFYRKNDLEDIQLLLGGDVTRNASAARQARDWGVARIWRYYSNAIDARNGIAPLSKMAELFGGDLDLEMRTGRSDYLSRHIGRFFVDSPIRNGPMIGQGMLLDLRPMEGESYPRKLWRVVQKATSRSPLAIPL